MSGEEILKSVPLGLGMALAQNMRAMERFAALAEPERQRFIDGAHRISSRDQMQAYVAWLGR